MHKYAPHVTVGGLGILSVIHLFFRDFLESTVQRISDATLGRVKKFFKRKKKGRKSHGRYKKR